jgi:hypothetical protein
LTRTSLLVAFTLVNQLIGETVGYWLAAHDASFVGMWLAWVVGATLSCLLVWLFAEEP